MTLIFTYLMRCHDQLLKKIKKSIEKGWSGKTSKGDEIKVNATVTKVDKSKGEGRPPAISINRKR